MAERLTRGEMFWQIAPPLLLVWLAIGAGDWGPGIIFGTAIFWPVAVYSFVRLVVLAFRRVKTRALWVRPVLSLIFTVVPLGYVQYALGVAKAELDVVAGQIHVECNALGVCPKAPEGWETVGSRNKREISAAGIRWPLFYYPEEKKFSLHLVKSLDLADCVEGGAGLELQLNGCGEHQKAD